MLSTDQLNYIYKQYKKDYKRTHMGFLTLPEIRALVLDAEDIDEAVKKVKGIIDPLLNLVGETDGN